MKQDNRVAMRAFQTALRLVYPPRCISCGVLVESDFALCGSCWRETPFITGLVCDLCGTPLPGEDVGEAEHCDDCLKTPRPWSKGRAALVYRDNARKLILGFKHGDRHEVVRPAAAWMARAAKPLLQPNMIATPIPLHWSRLLRRRFNQSASLSAAFSKELGIPHCPDLLLRRTRTRPLKNASDQERFEILSESIVPNPRQAHRFTEKTVLLIDDVMTSGATLAAAATACVTAGAKDVRILVLARAVKDV